MKIEKSLRARAMDILSRREVSRLELRRKLTPYAESEEEVEAVLDEFSERNWQSDERYTEAFVRSKSPKHGRLRLQQALAAVGVDEDLIRENLPDCEQELANACVVLYKKFKAPAENAQEKQKQLRFLLYRGFDIDTAMQALRSEWPD